MSISMSAMTGSCTVSMIEARIPKKVPPFSPERILPSASICSGDSEASRITWPAPCPSWSAPGHQYLSANFAPSRLTSSKWPRSTIIAAMPSQLPCVGLALKSQGQPGSQLQFFMYGPSRRQSAMAVSPDRLVAAPSLFRYGRSRNGLCHATPWGATSRAVGGWRAGLAARAGGACLAADARAHARYGRGPRYRPGWLRLLCRLLGGDDERDDVPVDRADGADVRLRSAPPT